MSRKLLTLVAAGLLTVGGIAATTHADQQFPQTPAATPIAKIRMYGPYPTREAAKVDADAQCRARTRWGYTISRVDQPPRPSGVANGNTQLVGYSRPGWYFW